MTQTHLIILFWVSVITVFYTYIGYGMVLYLLVKLKEIFIKPKIIESTSNNLPEVTLFITAYNEEDIVDEKMKNSINLNYPQGKLKILWVTDGSNDKTNLILENLWKNDAKVLFSPERKGKTDAINRGIRFVDTPLVIFTDANTMLNKDAIMIIVKSFNDPKVGCVAGEKRIALTSKSTAATGGEGLYWKYESTLKALDARLYSTVGAAGELFALRRELFQELRTETLLDDFVISLKVVSQGYTIAYCADAFAVENGSSDMQEEEKRKVRIAAGGVQSIWQLLPLLNPFKYGIFTFQYISHRVLRWTVTPILLFLLLPINVALLFHQSHHLFFLSFLILQIIFYFAGLWGYLLAKKKIKNKYLFIPYYFLFMNLNVLKGFAYLARKEVNNGIWEKSKRA